MSFSARVGDVRCISVFEAKLDCALTFLNRLVNDALDRDIELLRQIAAGNRAAFAEFYDRHSTLMFSVASRILNDPAEAQDVLQEVFVQIWEKAALFDSRLGKASSWAVALVRNKSIDRTRASQRRTRLAESAEANQA